MHQIKSRGSKPTLVAREYLLDCERGSDNHADAWRSTSAVVTLKPEVMKLKVIQVLHYYVVEALYFNSLSSFFYSLAISP